MPKYLNTRGQPTLSCAICDRCSRKMPLAQLQADGNAPGLRVCPDCCDGPDPYTFAPRRVEDITVPNPRPDEPLTATPTTFPDGVETGVY
jgi:hypothetical protein